MLIRLAAGLYIQPMQIASIVAFGPVMSLDNEKKLDDARVTLTPITGSAISWTFPTTEAARKFADELAEAANKEHDNDL